MDTAAPTPSTQFIARRGRVGFEQLLPGWQELVARSDRSRFMHHPDWYRALFDSGLANPDEYLFASAYAGARLVGIFPLEIGRQGMPGVGSVRRLGLCNHPHMALADIVVADQATPPGLLGELAHWLVESRQVEWDMLAFEKIPDRSATRLALAASPLPGVIASDTGASAFLPTDSEMEALGAVSTAFRRNLRRLSRRAETLSPLRLEACLSPESLGPALAAFLALEASGWKGSSGRGSAIANHLRLVAFYRALTEHFGRQGQCAILLLHHGDRLVAAHYGLLSGGGYHLLKIAYSEADAAIAPGCLLMERAIQWCCLRPDIHELSFVTAPAWSDKWNPRHDPVRTYRLFAPTLKGCLMRYALRAKHWHQAVVAARR